VDAEAFTYTAEIRPPAWPADGFHFSVLSQWDGAKDPLTARTALQLTTDREGLLVLRGLIDRALEDTVLGSACAARSGGGL